MRNLGAKVGGFIAHRLTLPPKPRADLAKLGDLHVLFDRHRGEAPLELRNLKAKVVALALSASQVMVDRHEAALRVHPRS